MLKHAGRRVAVVGASAMWVLSAACLSPPVQTPKTKVVQSTPIRVSQNVSNKVDLLFMVDNSPSMDAMQTELRARFKDLLQPLIDAATMRHEYADLHIGVVTSDYGAGHSLAPPCEPSPGGQKGLLQAVGAAAPAGCKAPTGAPFIAYAFDGSGGTGNLPAGQDLVTTFTCMASVGSSGCGFEHPLESVYAALHNTKENAGFVRDDALLVIVFVTNEDDASAPPTTDIFDPSKTQYGLYDTYRQTRYGVACGDPPLLAPYGPSLDPLTSCVPAENDAKVMLGAEYDVSRYIDYFTTPGLKRDPLNDLMMFAIAAPDTPFQPILAVDGTGSGQGQSPTYETCDQLDPPRCIVRLQHSCQNLAAPEFFGDPAVRLDAVIRKTYFNGLFDICGEDPTRPPDYRAALKRVGDAIVWTLPPGCIPAALVNPSEPDCTVEDVTTRAGETIAEKVIPRCDLVAGALPCWRVAEDPACSGISPQGAGVVIERRVAPAEGTVARVECATIAQ